MKKSLYVLAAALLAAGALTACGGNGEPNESPAGGSGGEAYLVGICQLAPHDALDAATRGCYRVQGDRKRCTGR